MASLYLITGWPSLGATCVSLAVFLAFEVGETPGNMLACLAAGILPRSMI
jgi:hypothetical protein